jgi:Pyruvate/2-oxoacid:ferredoxin oxidoreductase gamma subunit
MNNINVNKTTVRLASSMALIYRICFSVILLWGAKESDSEALKWIMLSIVSIMITFGLYRFVKMMAFANNLKKLEKALDK